MIKEEYLIEIIENQKLVMLALQKALESTQKSLIAFLEQRLVLGSLEK